MALLKIADLIYELSLTREQLDELLEIYYQHRKLLELNDLQKDVIIYKLWVFLQHYVDQNSPDMCQSHLTGSEVIEIDSIIESLNDAGITSIL
jgi:hypothetical protein